MKNNRLFKYLMITFLISWICWGVLILLGNNDVIAYSDPAGFIIFCIGCFGPTIAAIAIQDKRSPKSVVRYVFSGNHKAVLYLLLFCILLATTITVSSPERNTDMPLYLFPIFLIIMTSIGGGFEELGWRGFMQPTLEKSMPFPIAVVLTSTIWSVWHLPLWFVAGSGQQEMPFIVFVVFGYVLSFSMAAIHKKSKCVFYSCIFHGLSNTLTSFFVIGYNWLMVLGCIATIAVSLMISFLDKRKIVQRTK